MMPSEAAMPLPPRKPLNAGQLWPTTAMKPPTSRPGAPASHLPSIQARNDLSTSPTSVRTLGSQPSVRKTLVVPALPLPCSRMSM